MTIYLTHSTALEIWRRLDRRLPITALTDAVRAPDKRELEQAMCQIPLLKDLPRPLDILVDSPEARRHSKNMRSHAQAKDSLPALYCRLSEGVFVSAPELCLAQLARREDLLGLIEIGYELCGRYALRPDLPKGMTKRGQPLCSSELLVDFSHRLQGKGSQRDKYTRTVRYVREGSESPKETVQAMLATLPFKLGGYDIVDAVLNLEIPIPEELRKIARKTSYRLDLFWPRANLDLEYQSSEYHEGDVPNSADSRRSSVLKLMGIDVETNTPGQLYDWDATDALMGLIRHKLGLKPIPTSATYRAAQLKLRERLLGLPSR